MQTAGITFWEKEFQNRFIQQALAYLHCNDTEMHSEAKN